MSPKTTPKDFFLWVFSMGALVVSVISFIALSFEYIDRLLGSEPTYDIYSTGIRIAMATLIIVFPLFVWSVRYLNQDMRKNPEKKELWVRRWLIYIGLFVAAVTLIVDLIVLINTYLGGQEITTAFLAKVLTVLVIVGAAFLYYLRSLAGSWEKNEKASVYIGYGVSALVLVTVVGGFFIMGSPYELRLIRADQERVNDLQNIQSRIINYYQQKQELPESLEQLADPLSGFVVPSDPETGDSYTYNTLPEQALTFELCATFQAESPQRGDGSERYIEPYYSDAYWQHGVGQECFERTIDPEQYPPIENRGTGLKPVPAAIR